MKDSQRDLWSEWLLNRRFGGNAELLKRTLDYLYPVRDKVLENANLGENPTLLDVGCGDGLIGFGALKKWPTSTVLLSDISQDLLDHAQTIAQEMGVLDHCEFVRAAAEALSPIGNESVNAVTTRAVLIYVKAKEQAFGEFYRVLKPGGRLSIFEPINTFGYPEAANDWWGYDVTPVVEIAQKIKAILQKPQPLGEDPMLDFDERTLLELAEDTGFQEIHLEFQAEIKQADHQTDWYTLLRIAPNPKMPTLEEAMREALTLAETEAFVAYLRPLIEAKQGRARSAAAYLWAVK